MAKKITGIQVVTANRLLDGEVVFLRANFTWSEEISEVGCLQGEQLANMVLEKSFASVRANEVVDPYLIEVLVEKGRITPLHYREKMRTQGPTVRKDLGKQAKLDVAKSSGTVDENRTHSDTSRPDTAHTDTKGQTDVSI